jgi:hypothetical protein
LKIVTIAESARRPDLLTGPLARQYARLPADPVAVSS